MSKKNKNNIKNSNPNYMSEKRKERNEFIRNQPLLYIILALIAFFGGNYLFDLIAKFF